MDEMTPVDVDNRRGSIIHRAMIPNKPSTVDRAAR
jgi:hypothetical protein